VTSKFLILGTAVTLALTVMTANAQQKTASARQDAPIVPQTLTLSSDTAANSPAGDTTQVAADSAARSDATAARLLITTDPSEAAVKIDGKDYGASPVEAVGLDTGSHTVELSKIGYFRRKATIRLDAAGAELHFELSRPASLLVTSEPDGAQITINGQKTGSAPVQNDKMRPGEYRVTADLDGYRKFDTTVKLESGGVDTLRITLEPTVAVPPPQELERPGQAKKTDKAGKSMWQSSTILIAFFVFIAVLIGVEKSSY